MARKRNAGEGSIFESADGRWCGQLDLGWQNGRRVRKYFYGSSAAEVQEALLKARVDHAAALPVAGKRQAVGQFLSRWLEDAVRSSVRALTYEQYEQHVRLYLAPAFGKIPLHKLRPQAIQRFIAERLAAGLSPRTVRISLFVLRRALAQAVKWNLLAANPAAAVDLPRIPRKQLVTFTPEQARALLGAAQGDPYGPAYWLALQCGLRRGKLLALTWNDVDFDAATVTVRRALERIGGRLEFVEPKSTSGRRTLPLPAPVLAALKRHKARQAETRLAAGGAYEDGGLLFPNSLGRPLEPRMFNRQFKAALQRAGLPFALRLHDCRHFAATAMVAGGTDLRTVAGILGHADPSLTVRTYAHAVPEAARRAAERMGALLGEAKA